MEYSFTNAWGASWGTLKATWLRLAGAGVIYLLANIPVYGVNAVQMIGQLIQKQNPDEAKVAVATAAVSVLTGCFVFIYQIFVLLPLAAGLIWVATRAVRSHRVVYGDLLRGFRRFPSVIGTVLLVGVVQFIPIMLGLSVLATIVWFGIGFANFKDGIQWKDFDDASRAAIIVGLAWVIICAVICYWIAIRTTFSLFVVVDETLGRRGPLASIETSWRMTKGRALSLLGLLICLSVACMATLLACCVPFIFVGMPLCLIVVATAYNMLLAKDVQPQETIVASA